MDNLHLCFERALEELGLAGSLPCDLPGAVSGCLRFRISTGSPYLADHRRPSGDYIDHAIGQALALYRCLPVGPALLRIDREEEDAQVLTLGRLRRMGLPEPDFQQVQQGITHIYWQFFREPDFLIPLFREIVRGELDPAGLDGLCRHVYFLNRRHRILFHVPDDREVQICAPESPSLESLCARFAELRILSPEQGR